MPGRVSTDRAAILVVGPAWVGDMVMSQALYRHLARTRPRTPIDVLAPPRTAPLLQCMPQVRRAIELPLASGEVGLARRRRLGRELRGIYSEAIVLPNSFKSALVPWFAGIPRRTGWRGEMRYGLLNDLRRLDPAALPQMVQRFLALGLPEGAPLPADLPAPRLAVDAARARRTGERCGLAAATPLLALCPGAAFGGAKRWPPAYYAALARRYLAEGWQVALFGAAADRPVCAGIAGDVGATPRCRDLAGRTTLIEAVELLSMADAVVSNDSGLMHIAAALDRPLLAIFGPTAARFTPPLAARAAVLESPVDCAPCFQRECPLGHHRCMRDTSVDLVDRRLRAALAVSPVAP